MGVGIKWRRVYHYSGGSWVPDAENKDLMVPNNVFAYSISAACMHCENPACVDVCPTSAMQKDENGIVTINGDVCIGCRYCAHVASNTFVMEPNLGRSRAIRQDGDSTERIQEAIDTCPVDCIHWVAFESLQQLQQQLAAQNLQPRPQG